MFVNQSLTIQFKQARKLTCSAWEDTSDPLLFRNTDPTSVNACVSSDAPLVRFLEVFENTGQSGGSSVTTEMSPFLWKLKLH